MKLRRGWSPGGVGVEAEECEEGWLAFLDGQMAVRKSRRECACASVQSHNESAPQSKSAAESPPGSSSPPAA